MCHRFTYSLLFISYFLCRVLLLFCVFLYLDFLSHFILPLFLHFCFAYRVLYFSPSASWFLQFSFINSGFLIFYLPFFLLLRSLFLIHLFISLVRSFRILFSFGLLILFFIYLPSRFSSLSLPSSFHINIERRFVCVLSLQLRNDCVTIATTVEC